MISQRPFLPSLSPFLVVVAAFVLLHDRTSTGRNNRRSRQFIASGGEEIGSKTAITPSTFPLFRATYYLPRRGLFRAFNSVFNRSACFFPFRA